MKVISTIARASYGMTYHTPYNPITHKREDAVWFEREQEWRVDNLMRWYLEKVSQHPNTHSTSSFAHCAKPCLTICNHRIAR